MPTTVKRPSAAAAAAAAATPTAQNRRPGRARRSSAQSQGAAANGSGDSGSGGGGGGRGSGGAIALGVLGATAVAGLAWLGFRLFSQEDEDAARSQAQRGASRDSPPVAEPGAPPVRRFDGRPAPPPLRTWSGSGWSVSEDEEADESSGGSLPLAGGGGGGPVLQQEPEPYVGDTALSAAELEARAVCQVCMEHFKNCVLGCGHRFCSLCVAQLLSQGAPSRQRCPTCKAAIRERDVRITYD